MPFWGIWLASHPVRVAAVRELDAGGEHNCTSVLALLGVTAKSTMTHHWRVPAKRGAGPC
ncbi:hypothetical protein [Spirillospora sp. CA-294931]|uniref:hypothetical protein n=1 Tax=Spirillospora sp. CA-294931 TaxID=3240042 RepID=UPI003D8DDFD6